MSPRPSRICSIIDCGRTHHAGGFCRVQSGFRPFLLGITASRSAGRPSQAAQIHLPTEGTPLRPQEFGESDTSRSVVGPPQGALTELPPFFEAIT